MSGKGVADGHAGKLLSMLKIFTIKKVTLTFDGRSDNEGIVPRQAEPGGYAQGFAIQSRRGMHGQEWTKGGPKILFRVDGAHGLCKTAQGNVKELLHNLIADNSAARLDGAADQLPGLRSFLRRSGVEGIYEDVGVDKEPSAHSIRPE